jgi:hypothetical protein
MKMRIAGLLALIVALACGPSAAVATTVNVRVEGSTHTIFEGLIGTTVHQVTGDASGPHKCDGTNNGANPTAGPTPTGALDDAARKAGFKWSGSWSSSFDDFLVNSIGPDSGTSSAFWLVAVNFKPLQVGGCQFEVKPGDQVLWYFTGAQNPPLLKLSGPHRAHAGKAFRVKVIDGATGKPIAHAKVGGRKTNSQGVTTLRFAHRGVRRLKATRSDSIRSNQLRVKVGR